MITDQDDSRKRDHPSEVSEMDTTVPKGIISFIESIS